MVSFVIRFIIINKCSTKVEVFVVKEVRGGAQTAGANTRTRGGATKHVKTNRSRHLMNLYFIQTNEPLKITLARGKQ